MSLEAEELPTKVTVIDVNRIFMESVAGKKTFAKIKKFRDKKIEEVKKVKERAYNYRKTIIRT